MNKALTVTEMDTIATAIHLLSQRGILTIKAGEKVIEGPQKVGPLTIGKHKSGELTLLVADSSMPISIDELQFTMELVPMDATTPLTLKK